MWVLPKSITSVFAPGTEALTLDSKECSQACAQSLMRRSKLSQSSAYLREWKAGGLLRLRFGAISRPSLGKAFEEWWISSLGVTRASRLAPQERDLEPTTHDIFGPTLQEELKLCNQGFASSKTSKVTSRWDSPASSAIWKSWVIKSRGEYLVRLNAARHTSENGSSSWPTCTARDHKGCGNAMPRKDGKHRLDTLEAVVMFGHHAQDNLSTLGSRPASWATPRAGKTTDENPETWAARHAKGDVATMPLTAQVKAWATPRSCEHKGNWPNSKQQGLCNQVVPEQSATKATGKLNPRWVEALMGLPVGWTMPSCVHPVTIEQTSCVSSGTE
jgi:hypothetical protein